MILSVRTGGLILGVCLYLVVPHTAKLSGDRYLSKYDNVNLDEILRNERLYQRYFNCIRGAGKCTPDGDYVKEVLPEALMNDCLKCTQTQKEKIERIIKFLHTEKPTDWETLQKYYDPTCELSEKFKDKIQEIVNKY